MKEGEDLFDGVDLDFLAGSEEPVEAQDTTSEVKTVDSTKLAEDDGVEEKKDADSELGFELDYIANLDEHGEVTQEGEEDNDIDEGKRTPESKGLSSSPLTSLTSALHEEGVLSSLSEEELAEIKTGEQLIEAMRNQIRQNEYSDLTDDQKEYLEALRDGVPDQNYRQAKYSADVYSKIDASSLDNDNAESFRKSLIINDFLAKGFSQQDAEKYAQRSIDIGEDVGDSKAALGRLQEIEKQKLAKMSQDAKDREAQYKKAQEDRVKDLQEKVNASNEIVPGVKFNKQTKDKVFDLMTKTAGFDANNNPMNEVVKHMIEDPEYLIKLNYLHLVTDGFNDWSKVQSAAKRNAVNKLDESLKAQDAKLRTGTDSTRSSAPGTSGVIDAIRGFL